MLIRKLKFNSCLQLSVSIHFLKDHRQSENKCPKWTQITDGLQTHWLVTKTDIGDGKEMT